MKIQILSTLIFLLISTNQTSAFAASVKCTAVGAVYDSGSDNTHHSQHVYFSAVATSEADAQSFAMQACHDSYADDCYLDSCNTVSAQKDQAAQVPAASCETETGLPQCEVVHRNSHCCHNEIATPISCQGHYIPDQDDNGHWYCRNLGSH